MRPYVTASIAIQSQVQKRNLPKHVAVGDINEMRHHNLRVSYGSLVKNASRCGHEHGKFQMRRLVNGTRLQLSFVARFSRGRLIWRLVYERRHSER